MCSVLVAADGEKVSASNGDDGDGTTANGNNNAERALTQFVHVVNSESHLLAKIRQVFLPPPFASTLAFAAPLTVHSVQLR